MNDASTHNTAGPSFVDGFWSHLDAAASPYAEKRLAAFARQRGVKKWIIATDFCIRDQFRPNDSFAFVVFAAGEKFHETEKMVSKLSGRDLKKVKRIPPSIRRTLRSGRVFTFCFMADRQRRLYMRPEVARHSIDATITMMENWQNADACDPIISKVRAMRIEANKANLNTTLLENVIVTAAIVSYIALLLCRHSSAELIGWAPDRDKITEAYGGIAQSLFAVNVSALCQREQIKEPNLGFFIQKDDDLWCDPYIRLADYVAGLAAWDPPANNAVPEKISSLIRDVVASNRYLFVFRMAFHAAGDQCLCEIRRLSINRLDGTHRQPSRPALTQLRGRSKQLIRAFNG
jgi:hypothetical protein